MTVNISNVTVNSGGEASQLDSQKGSTCRFGALALLDIVELPAVLRSRTTVYTTLADVTRVLTASGGEKALDGHL